MSDADKEQALNELEFYLKSQCIFPFNKGDTNALINGDELFRLARMGIDSGVKLPIAQEALAWCHEMLTERDEMNAKVHCAPLRLSPLTERVKQALVTIRSLKFRGKDE